MLCSTFVCVDAVIERGVVQQTERVIIPLDLGEHAIIPAESFDVHVLIESCAENDVKVELVALRPYSTIYDGTILQLTADKPVTFTFENNTAGDLVETVRLRVAFDV